MNMTKGSSNSNSSSSRDSNCPLKVKGRRRVDMKKIEKKPYLYTTFSKRRAGLFKKAEVFCHQFGDNVSAAVFVLSPSGKLHSWGNPSADSIIDRYFHTQNQNMKGVSHYDDHGDEVSPSIRSGEGEGEGDEEEDGLLCFLQKEVEALDVDELKQLKDCLMELQNNVEDRIEEMKIKRENLIDFFALQE